MAHFSDLTVFIILAIIATSVLAFLHAAAASRRETDELLTLMRDATKIREEYDRQLKEIGSVASVPNNRSGTKS